MVIHQIPVGRHPALRDAHSLLLGRLTRPEPLALGDVLVMGRRPPDDEDRPVARQILSGKVATSAPALCPGAEFRSWNYYPPGGGQGWHTNSNAPGWRVYVFHSPGGRGYVRTVDGNVFDLPEHANVFRIHEAPARSWHAVIAPDERWSLGWIVPEAFAQELLRRP